MSLRYNLDALSGVVCSTLPSLNKKVVRKVIACTGVYKFNAYLEDINADIIEDGGTIRLSITALDDRWAKAKLFNLMTHLLREAKRVQ